MNARVIIGVISLCIVTTGAVLANMYFIMIIGEINRKRQDGNQVSYFGFMFPKMMRILNEYRSLYPQGKLHVYAVVAFGLSIVGLITVGVCLRIIG